jgi:hypothetical protein
MLAAWMINDDDGFEYYLEYIRKYADAADKIG